MKSAFSNHLYWILFFSALAVSSCSNQDESSNDARELDYTTEARVVSQYVDNQSLIHPQWIHHSNLLRFSSSLFYNHVFSQNSNLKSAKSNGFNAVVLPPFMKHQEVYDSLNGKYRIIVEDFEIVDEKFQSAEEASLLISKMHNEGLKVIMEWPSSPMHIKHPWVKAHPNWFKRDSIGLIIDSIGSVPTVEFNFEVPELNASLEAMILGWLLQYNFDGVFCSDTEQWPSSVWETVRADLPSSHALVFISDAEDTTMPKSIFDMTLSKRWERMTKSNGDNPAGIKLAIDQRAQQFDKNELVALPMMEGACSFDAFRFENGIILTQLLPGNVLFSPFCDCPDSLSSTCDFQWINSEKLSIVATLKQQEQFLWEGAYGAPLTWHEMNNESLLGYERTGRKTSYLVVGNLSAVEQSIGFDAGDYDYTSIFDNRSIASFLNGEEKLAPWEVIIFKRSFRLW